MSDDPLALIIVALAGWRLAYLLINESGPANVFGWLRNQWPIMPRANEMDRPLSSGSLEALFVCVYCMSFWTTAAAALIWALDIDAVRDAIVFIAAWGAATALDMVARRES